MKTIKVKEIMVPLAECGTLHKEATLHEAVFALEKAQQGAGRHSAVLILDNNQDVVGKIEQIDAIRGFEPGYRDMGELRGISRSGLSARFIESMIDKYNLWGRVLGDICRKAANAKVTDMMYSPTALEYVEEDATLDQTTQSIRYRASSMSAGYPGGQSHRRPAVGGGIHLDLQGG